MLKRRRLIMGTCASWACEMTILPKCFWLLRCSVRFLRLGEGNTLSMTGLRPFASMARFIASNICVLPT